MTSAAYSALVLGSLFDSGVLLSLFFLICLATFKMFVIFYIALLSDCSKSGSTLAQSTMSDWKPTTTPLPPASQEVENPMHLHSQSFLCDCFLSLEALSPVFWNYTMCQLGLFPCTILEPCDLQFWKHFRFPWSISALHFPFLSL